MARKKFSDAFLKSLKPAPAGTRYERLDSEVPGLIVRVTDKGTRTFALKTRMPGKKQPTRRAMGEYGAISLAEARQRARDWLAMVKRGEDPKAAEERAKQAVARRQAHTFRKVAEAYIADAVIGAKPDRPIQRKGEEVARMIRNELAGAWGDRPVAGIDRHDVLALIRAKKVEAPAQARNLLSIARTLFSWAVMNGYGLDHSPCDGIKPKLILGDKEFRDRTLNDEEVAALWRASRMPYPYGPIYRLLLLTGLRLNEVADARWSEFDIPNRRWVIPAERMKGKNQKARAHLVPITDDIMAVLNGLPRFKRGDYLFSLTFGEKSVWISSKVKERTDARMLRSLRAWAKLQGKDASKVQLSHWQNHDIRRTVRTILSSLQISEEVREAVLAHVRPGIKGAYDHYKYEREKAEALTLLAQHIRRISTRKSEPNNVVSLVGGRL
ncbi:MAG: integrase arm-type DNA-binding domain-containing protein [Pseudorhodoplanes sp.]|jgi:integrase|nr:integrase arm-type DNA-binding domain-containing protein [Pseudorhodoplanes sp.]